MHENVFQLSPDAGCLHRSIYMKLRNSRILREVREGRVAATAKINLTDPRVIELCGLGGYSGVWLCCEHVPNDWRSIEHAVRAAKVYDMDVIVRVSKGSYSDYILPFECDAAGIMVPHVTSAEEAREVVDRCRFQPLGRRPLDGGNVDGAYCQVPLEEYLAHANKERFIILQIESPEALEVVESIAAVPGYDFLLFGAGDFAHRIGKPGQYNCPEVEAARQRVERAALAHGKRCMAVGLILDESALHARGYSLVNLSSDVVGLGSYLNSQLEEFKLRSKSSALNSLYSASDHTATESLAAEKA